MPDDDQPAVLNVRHVGPYRCGRGERLLVIAGPCVIESEDLALRIAAELVAMTGDLPVQLVFKPRSTRRTARASVRTAAPAWRKGYGCWSGCATPWACRSPPTSTSRRRPPRQARCARCSRSRLFLARADRLARGGRPDGPRGERQEGASSWPPGDMRHVAGKLALCLGCRDVLLCERGTFFGYGRLVNDMRSIPQMQSPRRARRVRCHRTASRNRAAWAVPPAVTARWSSRWPGPAMAVGADGLFCETHPDPDSSPSDGPNMVPLAEFRGLLRRLLQIRDAVSQFDQPAHSS